MIRFFTLIAAIMLASCGTSAAQQVTVQRCSDGQPPTNVQPQQSYVVITCANGEIVTVQVPSTMNYSSTGQMDHDPFFWMWLLGPRYSYFPVYHTYIGRPYYHAYSAYGGGYHHTTVYNHSTTIYRGSGGYRSSGRTSGGRR